MQRQVWACRRGWSRRQRWLNQLRRCGVALPALLTGYLWLKGWHGGLPGLACPLRELTGVPCPTCFLTRATAAALNGQLASSVQLHAFGPLAAAALLVWSVAALRSGRLLPWALSGRHLVLAAVALLLYWAGRMSLAYGLGLPAFPSG